MIDVLVDMTALNTRSRDRGIGRYVRNLCHSLASREAWLERYPKSSARGLRIAGLLRHYGSEKAALDLSLSFAGDPSIVASDRRDERHKLERRLFLGGLARRTGARLLHLPDPPGTPFDRRLPRLVTCHDLIPLVLSKDYLSPIPGARAWQRARDIARYRSARRVIAISNATRRDLIEQLRLPPERIDVVYHGVDHERFTALAAPGERERIAARLGVTGPYLLYMGAGDPRKNLPLLVRAFARSRVAPEAALVLAGPIKEQHQRPLEALAARLGVGERVHVTGYVEDELLAALYRQCLAHVFPSSYEGFGLPVLEAMACGAPTVTTALSALGEVAGNAALILEALDEALLSEALVRIVSDAALRSSLSERGLSRARTFTWERCAAETLECYVRALGEERR